MCNRHKRMVEQHSWPGIPHDLPNPFLHFWLITMYVAVRTECFCFHKRALVNAHFCILHKFPAILAWHASMFVSCTVQANHQVYHLDFLVPFLVHTSPSHTYVLSSSKPFLNSVPVFFYLFLRKSSDTGKKIPVLYYQ